MVCVVLCTREACDRTDPPSMEFCKISKSSVISALIPKEGDLKKTKL
jgi:hypothetical protein